MSPDLGKDLSAGIVADLEASRFEWPISGDNITRARKGCRDASLAGVADWEAIQ